MWARRGADLAQSRLLPNPSLNAALNDVTVGATNPPGLGFHDVAIYGVTLTQTVEIGKRGPRRRSAELRLAAGHESYRDALERCPGTGARGARSRRVPAESADAPWSENLADARQILGLERSRLDRGDISGNDYDRLLLDTTVLEADVSQNRSDYQGALEACAALLYAPCDDHDADIAAVEGAAELPALPANWEQEVAQRPDLRALDLEEQSARQDAVLAARRKIPDPSVSLGYTRDKLVISGDQPRTLAFGVSIPLPLFDRGQHEAARATLRADELHQSAAATLARARADVASLAERRATVEHILGELKGEALPRSKRVLDSTVAAVNRGQLSMTDLLLARRTHAELTLKVMDLQFGAFSARNDLRQALGLDVKADSKEGRRAMEPTLVNPHGRASPGREVAKRRWPWAAALGLSLLSVGLAARFSPAGPSPAPPTAGLTVEKDAVAHRPRGAAVALREAGRRGRGERRDGRTRCRPGSRSTRRRRRSSERRCRGAWRRVFVELGQRVAAGAPLFSVASPDIAELRANGEKAAVDLEAARATLERVHAMVASRALPAKDELSAQQQLDQAELALKLAEAKLASLHVSSDGENEFTVASPREGVVVEKNVLFGQQVSPDGGGVLMVVADLSSVWVVADLFEAQANDVHEGAAAEITCPSIPELKLEGRVEMVSAVVDPVRHTVPIRVRLDNADGALRPNVYARVRFAVAPGPSAAVEIPASALVSDGERQYVYVQEKEGRFVRREVTTGPVARGARPGPRGPRARRDGRRGRRHPARQPDRARQLRRRADARRSAPLLPAQPHRSLPARRRSRGRRLVRVPQPDGRGLPRSHRHPGAGHHALPGPAHRGGRAARLDPPRARAERHAGPLPPAQHLALRSVLRDADLRRRRRPAAWRASRSSSASAEAELPGRRPAGARSAGDADRRGLPLHARGPRRGPDDAAHAPGLDGAPAAPAGAGRRRRRLLRRPAQGDPRRARPGPDGRRSASASSDVFAALKKASDNATGGYVERGAETFVIRSLGIFQDIADIEQVRVGFHEGVPVTVKDVAAVARRLRAAPGRRDPRRQRGRGRGHRAHAPRREPVGGARRRCATGSRSSTTASCRRASGRPLLRPHRPRQHDAEDRVPEPGRGRAARHRWCSSSSCSRCAPRSSWRPSSRSRSSARSSTSTPAACRANLLSMGAVDFGIIVDGAVILVEHLFHRVEGPARTTTAALVGADSGRRRSEVARPTLFSLLIIIAAYLPIFSLAARRGAHLRADGPHRRERARRRAARELHAGAGARAVSPCVAPRRRFRESPLLAVGAARLRAVLAFAMAQPRSGARARRWASLLASRSCCCRASARSSCPS